MTTPTPAEIRAAIELLLSVPGVTDGHCLEDIVEISSPLVQMTTELIDMFRRNGVPDLGRLASMIEDTAKRHGLRITTDPEPGELIGYQLVDKVDGASWERRSDRGWLFRPDDIGLGVARDATQGSTARIAAVILLPEGGKA